MKSAKQKQFIGARDCISAAAIWGLSFVAQSIGRGVGTFTFNALRMFLGSAVLWPVIAFRKKKAGVNVWLGVVIGLTGLYLLCSGDNSFSLEKGDIITIIGAFAFASQILIIDRFSPRTDPVEISSLQFFVCSILSGICMFIFEEPTVPLIMQKQNFIPIIYAGIMSCGVAFTFQTFGQKYTEPAVTSLLLCLESAFSVIFGWLILHQTLGRKALLGCLIMLVAVMLTQIQFPKGKNKQTEVKI